MNSPSLEKGSTRTPKEVTILPSTGERYLPGMGGRIAAEHLARYAFASQFVNDKKVLDIASGEGYGSAILAQAASAVAGVDIAEDAVLFARHKYEAIENVEFRLGDVSSLEFENENFDVITCFETIEHVADPLAAIVELKRVLHKQGLLVVSTPNRENYSARYDYDNPYHKKELEFEEFRDALSNSFKVVKFFGQFSGAASNIVEIDNNGFYNIPESNTDVTHVDVPKWTGNASCGSTDPLYFVAICSDAAWPIEPTPTEFFDPADWRTIEDEFLMREIRSSPSVNAGVVDQLVTQLNIVNTLRSELKLANLKLSQVQSVPRNIHLEEVNVLRAAFGSLKEEYKRLDREFNDITQKLYSIETSTTWRMTSTLRRVVAKNPITRKAARLISSIFVKKK